MELGKAVVRLLVEPDLLKLLVFAEYGSAEAASFRLLLISILQRMQSTPGLAIDVFSVSEVGWPGLDRPRIIEDRPLVILKTLASWLAGFATGCRRAGGPGPARRRAVRGAGAGLLGRGVAAGVLAPAALGRLFLVHRGNGALLLPAGSLAAPLGLLPLAVGRFSCAGTCSTAVAGTRTVCKISPD